MKTSIIYIVVLFSIFAISVSTHAQVTTVNIYGAGFFPGGYLQDVATEGYGGGLGIGMFLNPNFLMKATASYHNFGSKAGIHGAYAPLEIGTNVYLGYPGGIRPYLALHGGWYVASGDFRDSNYGFGGGVGLEIPLGGMGTSLQIEPGYTIVDRDDDRNHEYWTINIGIAFTLRPPSPIPIVER